MEESDSFSFIVSIQQQGKNVLLQNTVHFPPGYVMIYDVQNRFYGVRIPVPQKLVSLNKQTA
jgi:hypothetical protein